MANTVSSIQSISSNPSEIDHSSNINYRSNNNLSKKILRVVIIVSRVVAGIILISATVGALLLSSDVCSLLYSEESILEFEASKRNMNSINLLTIKTLFKLGMRPGGYLLFYTLRSKNTTLTRLLIEHGADVNKQLPNGKTPLHYVTDAGTAKLLIEKGADVNAQDHNGNTPLLQATRSLNVALAAILIENGADVNVKYSQENQPWIVNPNNDVMGFNEYRNRVMPPQVMPRLAEVDRRKAINKAIAIGVKYCFTQVLLQNSHIFRSPYPYPYIPFMHELNGMEFLEKAYNQVHDILTQDVAREVMSHITDVEAGCENNAERIMYVTDPRSRSAKLYLDHRSKLTKEDFDKIIEHHNLKSLHFHSAFEVEEFRLPANLVELDLRTLALFPVEPISHIADDDIETFKGKLAQELKQKKIKNIVLDVVSDEIIDALLENPIENICFNCNLTERQLERIQQLHSVKVFIVKERIIKNIYVGNGVAQNIDDGNAAEHKE
ncbi:MAG: ankyrin repeat domain-containing protein [Waddliaceae bacterium]